MNVIFCFLYEFDDVVGYCGSVNDLFSNYTFRVVGHTISSVEPLVLKLALALGCASSLGMLLLDLCKCLICS